MKIFFSVGEPSGDLHGSNLIREIRRRSPHVECVGFGGPKMSAAGCRLHEDLTRLAVMGLAAALLNLHKFLILASRADRYFRHHRPDALVLIDFPGFNWWIARRAKFHGIPVYYYGAPQLWAWGNWRVSKMRRLTDHVLCKLPFEEQWFRQRGCNAHYIGHPYFDELAHYRLDQCFLEEQRQREGRLVTILPGSRSAEVKNNLRLFLRAAERIRSQIPDVRFAVASYNKKQAEMARQAVSKTETPVEVYVDRTQELMQLATCCLACSGSVSLELLHYAKPTVILYWIPWFTYQVIRRLLIKVKYITLVNLLAVEDRFIEMPSSHRRTATESREVLFPEYPTWKDKSAESALHVIDWLTNEPQRIRLERRLMALRNQVGQSGASRRGADYIVERVEQLHRRLDRQPRPHFLPPAEQPVQPNRMAG